MVQHSINRILHKQTKYGDVCKPKKSKPDMKNLLARDLLKIVAAGDHSGNTNRGVDHTTKDTLLSSPHNDFYLSNDGDNFYRDRKEGVRASKPLCETFLASNNYVYCEEFDVKNGLFDAISIKKETCSDDEEKDNELVAKTKEEEIALQSSENKYFKKSMMERYKRSVTNKVPTSQKSKKQPTENSPSSNLSTPTPRYTALSNQPFFLPWLPFYSASHLQHLITQQATLKHLLSYQQQHAYRATPLQNIPHLLNIHELTPQEFASHVHNQKQLETRGVISQQSPIPSAKLQRHVLQGFTPQQPASQEITLQKGLSHQATTQPLNMQQCPLSQRNTLPQTAPDVFAHSINAQQGTIDPNRSQQLSRQHLGPSTPTMPRLIPALSSLPPAGQQEFLAQPIDYCTSIVKEETSTGVSDVYPMKQSLLPLSVLEANEDITDETTNFESTPPYEPLTPALSPQTSCCSPILNDSNSPKSSSPAASKKVQRQKSQHNYLWQFLLELLSNSQFSPRLIEWVDADTGIFKMNDTKTIARLWGSCKNRPCMSYETMGRALRYYYTKGILRRIPKKRLVYQFINLPTTS